MSFSWENWTTGLIVLGYDLLVILTIVILVFRRRETASIFSWSLRKYKKEVFKPLKE